MASRLEKELYCPVCFDIFTKPVLLPCSHSFCKDCLKSWWREKPLRDCPVCKCESRVKKPPFNLVLKNLCEAFLLERDQRASAEPEPLCGLHSEKLKLFCLDHKQPVCLICRDSKSHKDHKFIPIDEAAQDHREELQRSFKPLQDRLKLCEQLKTNCDQTVEHIRVQANNTESQIKEQIQKCHQFLQYEEDHMMFCLMAEKNKKSNQVQEKIEDLKKEMDAISNTIEATEKLLRVKDASFLQNYKAAVKRVQQHPLLDEPQLLSGALINEAQYLGNLTHNIRKMMKEIVSYAPVILDPNTAHPELVLSEDLTTVRRGERQTHPDNPERFDTTRSVLGLGLWTGTHSWVVEVGDSKDWFVGVAAESFQRKGHGDSTSGLWTLAYREGRYEIISPLIPIALITEQKKLSQVRVDLDFNEGRLSFSDHYTDTLIHTFTHTFTGLMYPLIATEDAMPLEILPVA